MSVAVQVLIVSQHSFCNIFIFTVREKLNRLFFSVVKLLESNSRIKPQEVTTTVCVGRRRGAGVVYWLL